jgi:probable HAF family extracellular repeat protein
MIARQGAAPKIEKKLMAMALGLLLGLPGLAKADVKFGFSKIDVVIPGVIVSGTAANANSPNAIAGEYDDGGGKTHGFIFRGGVYTDFTLPPDIASSTIINGINASGRLAGTYMGIMGISRLHAFFWSQGVLTTLDPSGSIRSLGGFLNAQGQVVGSYRTSDNKRHGFLWTGGTFKTFNVLNDHPVFGTVAQGINDPGQIVGNYVDADGNRHGFLLNQAPTCNSQPCAVAVTTLDVPRALLTVAEGINNDGVIAGLYVDEQRSQHGFVLSEGVYTTVDVPTVDFGTDTAVFSINAQGQIVGAYNGNDGNTHGFVGTPAD